MCNTATIIILSVVATVLVFGIGACIAIKPFTAIGLAPILAAISLIICAIRGRPSYSHEGTKHLTRHSSHAHTSDPTQQPDEQVAPQDLDFQYPVNATPDGIPASRDLMNMARPISDFPIAATGQQQAVTNLQHGNRRCWPRPTRHRRRKSR